MMPAGGRGDSDRDTLGWEVSACTAGGHVEGAGVPGRISVSCLEGQHPVADLRVWAWVGLVA